MGARETELRVNRRNTTAFISARPSELVLERSTRVRTPGAGFKDTFAPLLRAQRFRIIGQTTSSGRTPTTDGTARNVEFILLGEWDADVQVNDQWTEDGRVWRVRDILRSNEYELRAVVVEKGKGN